MKKIFSFLLVTGLVLSLFTGCQMASNGEKSVAKKEKLVMYTNAAFPPFEYMKDNKISGVDVDIANEIAKDMGRELEIKDVPFDSIIPAVVSGKADFGAAGMTVNAERLKNVDFSVKYVKSTQYIIMKDSSSFEKLSSLAGKRIGVQTNTTGDLYVATAEIDDAKGRINGKGSTIVRYNDGLLAAEALKAGKIDAIILDKLPSEAIVKANKGLKTVEFKYDDGTNYQEEYAIAVKKGNKEVLDGINKTLSRLISEGKIDSFLNKHTGV